jgi:hypothetical protein
MQASSRAEGSIQLGDYEHRRRNLHHLKKEKDVVAGEELVWNDDLIPGADADLLQCVALDAAFQPESRLLAATQQFDAVEIPPGRGAAGESHDIEHTQGRIDGVQPGVLDRAEHRDTELGAYGDERTVEDGLESLADTLAQLCYGEIARVDVADAGVRERSVLVNLELTGVSLLAPYRDADDVARTEMVAGLGRG